MCGGIARAEPEQAVAFDSLRHERQIVPLALELEAQFARYFYVLGLRNLRQPTATLPPVRLVVVVVVVAVVLTSTLVKNLESVVTQRCWSPRKIRKNK